MSDGWDGDAQNDWQEKNYQGKWLPGKLMNFPTLEKGSEMLVWKLVDMENDLLENEWVYYN